MKKFERVLKAEIGNVKDFANWEQELVYKALVARRSAQAPYFKFLVGAAVQSDKSTKTYVGCNVERCTGSQTTHAEQNAIDSMIAEEGSVKILRIAIVSGPSNLKVDWLSLRSKKHAEEKISVPCGHCLQIIWENCHGDENVEILNCNPATGVVTKITIGNALPFKFGPKDLGVDYKNPARQ